MGQPRIRVAGALAAALWLAAAAPAAAAQVTRGQTIHSSMKFAC